MCPLSKFAFYVNETLIFTTPKCLLLATGVYKKVEKIETPAWPFDEGISSPAALHAFEPRTEGRNSWKVIWKIRSSDMESYLDYNKFDLLEFCSNDSTCLLEKNLVLFLRRLAAQEVRQARFQLSSNSVVLIEEERVD